MPQQTAKNASGAEFAFELPNVNGRAAAAASRPIVLATEDKAALDLLATLIGEVQADPTANSLLDRLKAIAAALAGNLAITAAALPLPAGAATAANQADIEALLAAANAALADIVLATEAIQAEAEDDTPVSVSLAQNEYEACPAGATTALGAAGAVGDHLEMVTIVPATTSPGAVSIKDGADAAITIFTGGAASVSNLVPFNVMIGAKSRNGAWQIVAGANVSVLASGDFT